MSYFDDASLVMIPSGYKTSKVYSVKPTDGSGDLTFSRSNDTATRVNSAGLIEKVRTNVALYSEQFDNAYWGKANVTVTANTTVNPVNGATTADTLTRTGGASGFLNRQIAQTGIVTFSIFAKAGTTNQVRLNIYDGSTDRGATYNLTTGAISSVYGSPLFTTAQSFGSGWYRISISVNAASYTDCQVQVDSVNSVIIFGAQLETGDIATDYIATTSSAVSVGPVANVPRLDYLNSSCPRLLLEPQRQNVITFSEQMDNADWTKEGITITANATTSPDGYTNADKLVASASAGDKITYQVATVSNGVAYTASAYYKASEYTYAFMRLGGITGNPYVIYNLSTQALVGSASLTSSSITSVGNGWYRITATATTTTTVLAPNVMLIPSTGYTLGGDNVPEFTGNGTSGGFVWGIQLEAGAYATSYIPTLGAAVTRGADACSKTGISSLIGQTEGTLFVDVVDAKRGAGDLWIAESVVNDGNTGILIYADSSNTIAVFINGASNFFLNASVNIEQPMKIAVAYKSGAYALAVNGAIVATSTNAMAPPSGMNQFAFVKWQGGSNGEKQSVRQAILFPTRLSNSDLAALTA